MGIKGREMSFTKEDKSEMVGRNFKEKGRGEKVGLRSADYWIPSPSGTTGRVASERKGANKNLDGALPKSPVLSRTRLVYPSRTTTTALFWLDNHDSFIIVCVLEE